MRVANKSIFDASKYQLASIAEELSNANLILTTGKRINNLSDDPVGLTQGLNIKAALKSIEQLGRNISLGMSSMAPRILLSVTLFVATWEFTIFVRATLISFIKTVPSPLRMFPKKTLAL